MSKFDELFNQYNCSLNDESIQQDAAKIINAHFAENNNAAVYKQCLSLIDLTSLNVTDTDADILALVNKVNNFSPNFPKLSNVAAICVYPSLVPVVVNHLTAKVGIASVAAGFPASQTFVEIKVAETAMALMEGATEIDVVLSVGKFLEQNYEDVYEELSEIKAACRDAKLKIILETGALPNATSIKKASILAMASGADFIKTSTGKIPVAATLETTYILCHAIKEWYEKTGVKVSYKVAGGIVTPEEAAQHYTLVKEILGAEWLNPQMFRIGASRLANNLLTAIEGNEQKYF